MGDITDMQQQIRKHVEERDWSQFHNMKDMAISLSLESAEVLELFQWKSPAEIDTFIKEHKTDLAEELVDVLYWVVYMADKADIDLTQAFAAKMEQNRKKYPVDKARGTHKKYTELDT